MIRVIISVLLLSVLGFGQPVEGPWVVWQDTDKAFSDVHLALRNNLADVFYVEYNPADSLRSIYHAVFSLTDHQIVGSPEAFPRTAGWYCYVGDVISDYSSQWLALTYESSYNYGSGFNKTRLLWGANSISGFSIVDSGYMSPMIPSDGDHSNSDFSLRERIGGGWLMGWIYNGVYDFGFGSEPDNSVFTYFLDADLSQDTSFLCCNNCTLYGPSTMKSVSVSHDSIVVIQCPYINRGYSYLNRIPARDEYNCDTLDLNTYLDFRRTNGGRMLAFSGIRYEDYAIGLVEVSPEGIPTELGGFNYPNNPDAIAWNPSYGYAMLFTSPTQLLLARIDTNGVQVQPIGTLFWADVRTIANANLTIDNDGTITALWSECEVGSANATVLRLASVEWNAPLAAEPSRSVISPSSVALSAFPNPFNPSTTLSFTLPRACEVKLTVFDITGRNVGDHVGSPLQAGEHEMTFAGSGLPSGIYFARLEANGFVNTQKMILLK